MQCYSMANSFKNVVDINEAKKMIDSGEVKFHHTGTGSGYVSRKIPEGIAYAYEGRFGKGYVIARPRWDCTSYVYLDYYVA